MTIDRAAADEPPAARPGVGRVLRTALRSPPARGALVSYLCFRTGEMATWIGTLVWAFDVRGTTGSGIIAIAQLVPAALLAPLGSVLGERMRHRQALIAGFLLQALAAVVIAVAFETGAGFTVVCLAAALLAGALSLSRPIYYATLPDLVRSPDELTSLNSASTATEGAADFIGPAVAAVVFASAGAAAVMEVSAVVFLAAALAALAIPPSPSAYVRHEDDAFFELLRSGAATLAHDHGAAMLTALAGIEYVVIGTLDILGVVLALDVLGSGPGGPGLLASAMGIGAVVGAALTVVLVGRRRLAPAIVVGALVIAAPVIAAAAVTALPAAWVLFAIVGAGTAFLDVAARTLTQRVVAPQVLARVFGLQETLVLGGTAVGTAIATALVALFGARGAFVAAGLILPVMTATAWRWIRRLDERSALPGEQFALLQRIPMFAVLPQARLELLARRLEPTAAEAGAEVVRQGDVGEQFFLLVDGVATVTIDGHERRRLGPGDSFGEIALLHDVPRTATVTAVTTLRLERLDRENFLAIVTGTARSNEAAQRHTAALLNEDPHN